MGDTIGAEQVFNIQYSLRFYFYICIQKLLKTS